jgi:threonine synthase
MLMVRDDELARRVGCGEVYLAFEGLHPTGSFKDRGSEVAISAALTQNRSTVGVVSTGNMASSVAAVARRNRIPAVVVVSGSVPEHKLELTRVYAPAIVRSETAHDELYFEALAAGRETGVYFMNSDDPMRLEGQKTALYDIYSHLDPKTPTVLCLPVSSGGNFLAYAKAGRELQIAVGHPPMLVGVQAEGCAPIANAWRTGGALTRVAQPESIAHAICNPYPPSGDRVLHTARRDGHRIIAVADGALLRAQQEVALRHGLWVQVDAAASIAGLEQLALARELSDRDVVVCVLTGAGYRDVHTLPAERGVQVDCGRGELVAALRTILAAPAWRGVLAARRSSMP